jgi:hypothetical protein
MSNINAFQSIPEIGCGRLMIKKIKFDEAIFA